MQTELLRTVFFALLLFCGSNLLPAQGPPVPVDTLNVSRKVSLKEIPIPGSDFDFTRYAPAAKDHSGGTLVILFKSAKMGKAKKAKLELLVSDDNLFVVNVGTKDGKAGKRLFKQLRKQFGDPYKLTERNGRSEVDWQGRNRKTPYLINCGFVGEFEKLNASLWLPRK